MKTQDMYKEIKDYCASLILNSNIEDWDGGSIIKDNILIRIYWERGCRKRFPVTFYNKHRMPEYEFFIEANMWCNLPIQRKFKEISKYLQNIDEYQKAKKIYDLLPLKVIRKKKLESITTQIICMRR